MAKLIGAENLITQPLYDTVQAAAAVPQVLNFFTVPLGGLLAAGIVKTYLHTNMLQPQRLESDQSFLCNGMAIVIKSQIGAGTRVVTVDYEGIMENSFLQLIFEDTTWFRLPLNQMPGAAGEGQMFSNIAPAVTEFKNNHGLSSAMNYFRFDNTIEIGQQEAFRVQLDIENYTVTAVTNIQIMLMGQLKRAVR